MKTDDQLVDWIDWFLSLHRYAPSVRDVSGFLEVTVSTAHHRLELLRHRGRVDWNEGEVRTLRTVERDGAEVSG